MAATQQPIVTSGDSKKPGNIKTIAIVIATIILAGVAIFTAVRLYQLRQEAVAPTAPESEPEALAPCVEQCPDSEGILRNCTPPEGDGTSEDSVCYDAVKGRIESCGGVDFCCSYTSVTWTRNMAACQTTAAPTTTPTDEPTSTPTSTSTSTGTSTPTSTATATPDTLLDAGVSFPTILSAGVSLLLILGSLVLIF